MQIQNTMANNASDLVYCYIPHGELECKFERGSMFTRINPDKLEMSIMSVQIHAQQHAGGKCVIMERGHYMMIASAVGATTTIDPRHTRK